jgi:hypothetical protein
MAIKKPVVSDSSSRGFVFQWIDISAGDECVAIELPPSSLRSVQFSGDFAGASVSLCGSNDKVEFLVLTDGQGNSLVKSIPAIEGIQEVTKWVSPLVAHGSEDTKVTITLFIGKGI